MLTDEIKKGSEEERLSMKYILQAASEVQEVEDTEVVTGDE